MTPTRDLALVHKCPIMSIVMNSLFFTKKKLDQEKSQMLALFQQNGIDDSHKLWHDVADWQYT